MTPKASTVLERCGTTAAGPHGLRTAERLLNAALAEFDELGYLAASVDGIAKRAKVAHGTFYRYFGSKEQLFRALAQNALSDMEALGRRFPHVRSKDTGKHQLRKWVGSFCETYAAHSAVLRNLSQAEVVGSELSAQGLRPLFAIAEAMAAGMAGPAAGTSGRAETRQPPREHAELTAIACLMMLERVNYLISVDVTLAADVADRLTEIVFAAFFPPPPPPPSPHRQATEAARLNRIRRRRRQARTAAIGAAQPTRPAGSARAGALCRRPIPAHAGGPYRPMPADHAAAGRPAAAAQETSYPDYFRFRLGRPGKRWHDRAGATGRRPLMERSSHGQGSTYRAAPRRHMLPDGGHGRLGDRGTERVTQPGTRTPDRAWSGAGCGQRVEAAFHLPARPLAPGAGLIPVHQDRAGGLDRSPSLA